MAGVVATARLGRLTLGAMIAAQLALAPLARAEDAPVDPELKKQQDQLALMKAELENQKLALENAEAARALTEAKRKSVTDLLPDSDTSGAVTVKDGAGEMESTLLAARATRAVADDIARSARNAAKASAAEKATNLYEETPCTRLPTLQPIAATPQTYAPILLVASTDSFAFGHWEQFRFRACGMANDFEAAFAEATTLPDVARPKGQPSAALSLSAALGAAEIVSVGVELAKLVTPDWEVGSVSVTSTDRALMTAVAGEYLALPTAEKGRIFWTGQVSKLGAANDVFAALRKLDELDRKAAGLIDRYGPGLKKAQAEYDAAKPEDKEAAKAKLDKWKPVVTLQDAREAYAKLIKDLNGKEAEALLPINLVVQQAANARLLGDSGLVLSVSMQNAGGGYYSRRVIWNAIVAGRPPYFVSGGVVVNFNAVRPADQQVLAGGLYECSAGYIRLNKVATTTGKAEIPAAGCAFATTPAS